LLYDIVVLGVALSLIYYELTDISPGGIIVPGYIALYLDQPYRIIATLTLSLFSLMLVNIISNYTILYGRRKFGLLILVSFIVKFLMHSSIDYLPLQALFATTSSIGNIIPAIIAQDIDRQGFLKTVSSMILVASLVKLVYIVVK